MINDESDKTIIKDKIFNLIFNTIFKNNLTFNLVGSGISFLAFIELIVL